MSGFFTYPTIVRTSQAPAAPSDTTHVEGDANGGRATVTPVPRDDSASLSSSHSAHVELTGAGGRITLTSAPAAQRALPQDGFTATNYTDVTRVTVNCSVDETDVSDLEGVRPFKNAGEQQEAMDDRRYKRDPYYRQMVNKRIAAGGL